MTDEPARPYRLEDDFCPGCLAARHDLCNGLDYWCTCWCIQPDARLAGIADVPDR